MNSVPTGPHDQVVIVGAGLAGVSTAQQLRAKGWAGPVTLLGAEPHQPYDRPPLSKELLAPGADDQVRPVELAADFAELDVTLRTSVTATGLNPADRTVRTDSGDVSYRHLVLATGARARTLPGADPRDHPAGVRLLRTLDDARSLRAVLTTGRPLVVVGAGWIGAEVTTAARAAGCPVTVLEAAHQPLPGVLPESVARQMRPWYETAGATLRTGATVAAVRHGEVELADGTLLPAGAVLIGIGSRPDTDWLADSGLDRDAVGAVVTDDRLRASVPGVYALGDCASFPSARYGRRLLVQHWDNALQAAATVAGAVIHGAEATEPYDPVPYFWSEQFGRHVQFAGLPGPADQLCWRGTPDGGSGWTVCWFAADPPARLSAVLTVDRPRDLAQGRRLISRAVPMDAARAADPEIPLKAAVAR